MSGEFASAYQRSMTDRNAFWAEAADGIDWDRKWDTVLDDSNPPFYRWFSGGMLNTCYNALDRHVENGRADQNALIYDSPMTDQVVNSPIGNCGIRWRSLRGLWRMKVLPKGIGLSSTCR